MPPTTEHEQTLLIQGYTQIAGIDEAGRGCWAGPVVAAAVVLPLTVLADPVLLAGVDDSKRLSAARRLALCKQIKQLACSWGVGVVPAHVIDTHGILNATRLAMQIALLRLPVLPEALLIDAVTLHHWPCPQQALIHGDARCISIAAASIVAKVTRDNLMDSLACAYPAYRFGEHKGYGTAAHEQALHHHGPSEQHRRTFRPVQQFLTHGVWPTSGHATSDTIVQQDHYEDGYEDRLGQP